MPDIYAEAERRRLAGRGRTLHERVQRPPETPPEPPEDATEWMDEWRDRVADGDADDFARRLAREGIDPDACERYLGSHAWPRGEPVPEWVDGLESMLAFAADADFDPESVADAVDEESVPFAPILAPFVAYAREVLDDSDVPDDASGDALGAFDGWFVERLRMLFAQTLFVEFKTFIARQNDGDADEVVGATQATDEESDAEKTEYYDEFTTAVLDEGLEAFFLEYSFLARLLVTTIEQWTEAVEEFWSRLAADRADLRATFGDGSELGAITDLDVLGDRHGDGRAVVGVTFESGTKVAYKPRDSRIENAFNDLLEWINDRSDLPEFETFDCLTRDGYGWAEWVNHDECRTEAEVRRYYRRAGLLTGLLHATNFTDGHYENVVSKGEQPVLVDVETIAQPALPVEKTLLSAAMNEIMSETVLRTSLLPLTISDDDSRDISGFGDADITFESVSVPEFSDVNTDAMELEFADSYSVSGENLPQKDGEVQLPAEHATEIERGFEQMYEFLMDASDDLLGPDGPLAAFEDTEIRHLHRATMTYASILKSLQKPKYLRTGLKYGCKVDALAKPFATDSVDEALWPVYESERTAITRLDVPKFSLSTSETDLRFDGEPVAELCEESPLEQMCRRLRNLDETDRDEQLEYVRLAFRGEADDHAAGDVEPVTTDETLSANEIERAVETIADRIVESATPDQEGDPIWYLRERNPDGGVFLRKADADLYTGRLGIALFFAASSRVLDRDGDREFAEALVSPVRERLHSDEDRPFGDLGVGGGSGLGSVVYGFTTLGRLLEDDSYVADAHRAAELLTPERIREDERYDVLTGSAGAVLSLLALSDETGDPDVRQRAVACGDHLLSNRVETDGGWKVWRTIEDEQAQIGFSHGTSGIAYALMRLANVTGERRFEDAACEALGFEREQFAADRRNWPDRRSYASKYKDAWCYGRSGVGLARLGMVESGGTEQAHRDLECALDGLDAGTLTGDDHVCCGNFGRVEFALEASDALGEEHEARARQLATAAVRRAGPERRFSVEAQTNYWNNPTFFKGEAGIGYELLRLRSPDLPSVLRWK